MVKLIVSLFIFLVSAMPVFADIPNLSGSSFVTIETCLSGNSVVSGVSSIDFNDGQGIALEHCGAPFVGAPPTSLVVSASGLNGQGPTGSTSYAYKVACVDDNGGVGIATAAATITNGNAVLGTITQSIRGIAFNRVSWSTICPGTAVWRSISGGSYVLLGVFGQAQRGGNSNTIDDAGLQAASIPWIPPTPTTVALSDRLVTTVVSGAGTTNLTLANPTLSAVASAYVRHDDTAALNAYLSTTAAPVLPSGLFNVEAIWLPSNIASLSGAGANTVLQGWSASSPVLSASGVPFGFSIRDLTISPIAWGNAFGLLISSTSNCKAERLGLSGHPALVLAGVSGCSVRDNTVSVWTGQGIFDYQGTANVLSDNYIQAGQPNTNQNIASIHTYQSSLDTISHNKSLGGSIYSVQVDTGNQNVIEGNYAVGHLREMFHFSGSVSGSSIIDNQGYGGSTSIDYCISISDDATNGATLHGNLIAGNYLYQCGTSAIAVSQFGGTGVSIDHTVISANTIQGSNVDGVPATPDIFLSGSGVSYTYINDNTMMSGSAVDYNVEENSLYGLPNHTQVGAGFGIPGTLGITHLTGAGSAVLSGHSSGL